MHKGTETHITPASCEHSLSVKFEKYQNHTECKTLKKMYVKELSYTGCPRIIVSHLRGYCRGAIDSIILVFTQFA